MTAIGGTTQIDPEVAVFFSGGGFSRYFSQPSYHTKIVEGFLEEIGDEFKGLFKCVCLFGAGNLDFDSHYSPAGRAYPDVSAQGFK